jgi:hypothetical protein
VLQVPVKTVGTITFLTSLHVVIMCTPSLKTVCAQGAVLLFAAPCKLAA